MGITISIERTSGIDQCTNSFFNDVFNSHHTVLNDMQTTTSDGGASRVGISPPPSAPAAPALSGIAITEGTCSFCSQASMCPTASADGSSLELRSRYWSCMPEGGVLNQGMYFDIGVMDNVQQVFSAYVVGRQMDSCSDSYCDPSINHAWLTAVSNAGAAGSPPAPWRSQSPFPDTAINFSFLEWHKLNNQLVTPQMLANISWLNTSTGLIEFRQHTLSIYSFQMCRAAFSWWLLLLLGTPCVCVGLLAVVGKVIRSRAAKAKAAADAAVAEAKAEEKEKMKRRRQERKERSKKIPDVEQSEEADDDEQWHDRVL
jgi:hypothetical protein